MAIWSTAHRRKGGSDLEVNFQVLAVNCAVTRGNMKSCPASRNPSFWAELRLPPVPLLKPYDPHFSECDHMGERAFKG